jgi:hypothetical protein
LQRAIETIQQAMAILSFSTRIHFLFPEALSAIVFYNGSS